MGRAGGSVSSEPSQPGLLQCRGCAQHFLQLADVPCGPGVASTEAPLLCGEGNTQASPLSCLAYKTVQGTTETYNVGAINGSPALFLEIAFPTAMS